jgi:hypothetical protein
MRLRSIPILVVILAAVAGLGAWTDKPKVKVSEAPVVERRSRGTRSSGLPAP